jgi:excisionase family DNA binding protein
MTNKGLISENIQEVDREGTSSSMSNGTLLTVDEVASILRLKPETILRSMARRGDLPAIKLGRVWRFRSSSITQMLED